MKIKKYCPFFMMLAISGMMITSCSNNENKNDESAGKVSLASGKEKYQHMIDSIETKMQATRNMPLDQGTAMFAMRCYDEYASYFPDETKSPEYLFKAGELANSLQLSQPALSYLSRVMSKYPNYKNAPYALFMQGMIYDDQLKDTANARKMYKQVIAKYPESQLAKDAQASINNLGKSVEDLVREFEKNQAASAKK
jgi:outer membrane protein assembly factor BamD (BamD/ComL family)